VSYPNDCWLIRCVVGQVITIDVLPDDVLLTIFDFYVVRYQDLDLDEVTFSGEDTKKRIDSWQSLVHVCRQWRGLVFASPRRLDLQLYHDSTRSTRRTLDVWPALPLLIKNDLFGTSADTMDNLIAELEHSDRIRQITLYLDAWQIEKFWTAMQVPFPELDSLYLSYGGVSFTPVLPDSFLGGSAPHLRFLALTWISFPGLPKLLLSATHLVHLWLVNLPHSGYISPEAMATYLSMLTSLEEFQLELASLRSSPDLEHRPSPPPTRSILPALMTFRYKGVNEYLEELVARIDTPRLSQLSAVFFNDIDFETPELIRFVSRSSTFKASNKAKVSFGCQFALVKLQPQGSNVQYFEVGILCRERDWQLSSLARICTTSLSLLSTTENLFIYEPLNSQLDWKDDVENFEWLGFLHPFTAVKDLYISKQVAPRIAPALQEMTGGGTIEMLSTLQNLYLEGFQSSEFVEEGIERFISARQLTNRPVAISVWERDLTDVFNW
jgi:F-box-like